MRSKDRVAIVSGAETAIGKAIAERLASEGAAVVLADIALAGPVARAIREGGRVDILVTNAAISASIQLRPFEQIFRPDPRRRRRIGLPLTEKRRCCRRN
jgi:NAD(P)-dependent dehydrogenase (short-subunit alcohol dehydrogenase family)